MPHDVISRYQPTYRHNEIDLVIRLAKRGQSLGFVGIAGVGKSNVVNFLRDISRNAPQIEQDAHQLCFPIVDATQWQRTPLSLWQLMLKAVDQAVQELPSPAEDNKVIQFSEEERIFAVLEERVNWLCQEAERQVMFILDDFDTVLQTGPLPMLERLNVLRSEGNRGFLSYLVFTKRLPHVLGRSYDFENSSKFYDLFRHNIYALEPYSRDDALRMLKHLNELADNPLSEDDVHQIYQLAGGHAALLRSVFNVWIEEGASGIKVKYFANKPDVQQECRRILANLHEDEQKVALLAAQGIHEPEHEDVLKHLMRRGLLVRLDPATWFSPLMSHVLKTMAREEA